jgi:hypothetical protein
VWRPPSVIPAFLNVTDIAWVAEARGPKEEEKEKLKQNTKQHKQEIKQ